MNANYASLEENHEPDEAGEVLYHQAEISRQRWNHIENLDSFFQRMYQYHQKRGFFCILLQEMLELCQYIFIVILTLYVFHGINYPVLFGEKTPSNNGTKVTLHDVILPINQCINNFTWITWFLLIITISFGFLKLIKGVYLLFHFWDIKQFYNTALHIDDNDLDNLTWHDVQARVKIAQLEQQMCIHKSDLTELDIYHRILRQQNYFVALVNKKLMPPRLSIPYLGDFIFWTTPLKYNIQWLFFWSPWAPFENPWHLKDDYKKPNMRLELANHLKSQILWLTVANIVLAPLIFLWYVLYAFFGYAAIIRKEPGILAKRRWSLYGRLYLRHFNELDHELQARLTRAYRPASRYLAAFNSPIGTIIAESFGFFATAILAVFAILTLYDEDVLSVENVLSIMTILTLFVASLRNLSPDETTPWDPELLLQTVVAHTHYLPQGWAGQAHTQRVRREFECMFQYGFAELLESTLSPLITPYVLYTKIYPRALDFIDFFRNFTVNVVGVGDVCSFAQMDVRKHGNPDWQDVQQPSFSPTQYVQAEDGKTELSLLHFTYTNPSWKPPIGQNEQFIKNINTKSSVWRSESMGEYFLQHNLDESFMTTRGGLASTVSHLGRLRGVSHNEGPNLQSAMEMAKSVMFLHNLNQHNADHKSSRVRAQESTPLLPNR